jgi:putative ATPase
VEFVGLPEAQLNLAHAVIHLATAPKSNRVTQALGRARSDVREVAAGQVPAHLRDASYRAARKLGHGTGYEYPHDDPRGWVPQEYRPPEVAGRVYYEPTAHGHEREIAERMQRRKPDQP